MDKKYRRKLISLSAAGGALVLYMVLRRLTGFSVPCIFHTVTGLKCPGCGVTHMVDSLLSFDIKGAREANPFIFFTSPFLLFEIIYEFLIPHKNKRFHRINNIILIIYCIALLAFGVIRNIPQLNSSPIL
ncbi:MAG: DUF2752 domain-containing protein [Lachnospiraceae bacterium]|nr:DUF2752 domain-containing protein [Lachnospiraceae bacterium]